MNDQPLVFDDSERKAFEGALLEELSFASAIPKDNLKIEEVRFELKRQSEFL